MTMWNEIVWHLRQLLPLGYVTTYIENGQHYVCAWKMWFGRCYKVRRWQVVREVAG